MTSMATELIQPIQYALAASDHKHWTRTVHDGRGFAADLPLAGERVLPESPPDGARHVFVHLAALYLINIDLDLASNEIKW